MKKKLSATFAGSAYHEAFTGGPAGAAFAAPADLGAAGSGTTQRRRKVPDHSAPAAFLAAETNPSTVGGSVCVDAIAMPATTASDVVTPIARNFMSFLQRIANALLRYLLRRKRTRQNGRNLGGKAVPPMAPVRS
jgi:hypothetical protein